MLTIDEVSLTIEISWASDNINSFLVDGSQNQIETEKSATLRIIHQLERTTIIEFSMKTKSNFPPLETKALSRKLSSLSLEKRNRNKSNRIEFSGILNFLELGNSLRSFRNFDP